MSKYTHIFREAGNGFPAIGDEVVIADDNGWHQLRKVASVSRIQTQQWQANTIYLTLKSAQRDYDELSGPEQNTAWEDLHHVEPVTAD